MGTIAKVTAGGGTHLIASSCYGECSTAADTADKVATIQDSQTFTLIKGTTVHIKMANTNSIANPTLNVNSTGAIAIKRYGTTAPSTNANSSWNAGSVISFTYDGTYWQMNDFGLKGNDNTIPAAYCSTAAATAAKIASQTGYVLTANTYDLITFTNANSYDGAITLNINNRGAKPLYINGSASSATNYTLPAGTYIIYYDGSKYDVRTDGSIPNISSGTGSVTSVSTGTGLTGGPITNSGTISTYLPRVNQDSQVLPGKNKIVWEEYNSGSANLPTSSWYHIISMQGTDTKYGTQLALGMTTNGAYYRKYDNQTWGEWQNLLGSSGVSGMGINLNNILFSKTVEKTDTTLGQFTSAYDGWLNVSDLNGGSHNTFSLDGVTIERDVDSKNYYYISAGTVVARVNYYPVGSNYDTGVLFKIYGTK